MIMGCVLFRGIGNIQMIRERSRLVIIFRGGHCRFFMLLCSTKSSYFYFLFNSMQLSLLLLICRQLNFSSLYTVYLLTVSRSQLQFLAVAQKYTVLVRSF